MHLHKAGYVNILGKPNAGKSTLLNKFLDLELSITNKKAQTTRRRILGIWNDDNHQIVFSDTPGIIENPAYMMQEKMNKYILQSFEDADVILFLVDINDPHPLPEIIIDPLSKTKVPKFLVINKVDIVKDELFEARLLELKEKINWDKIFLISALLGTDTTPLLNTLKAYLPENPPYFPKDQLSDANDRFFVSDIIRKHILSLYQQEIPYSCEVYIDAFVESQKNGKDFAHISATIFVSRASQKSILIGKKGEKIKQLGIDSRTDIEAYLGHPVFLELFVKVKDNWRDNENQLKSFGY